MGSGVCGQSTLEDDSEQPVHAVFPQFRKSDHYARNLRHQGRREDREHNYQDVSLIQSLQVEFARLRVFDLQVRQGVSFEAVAPVGGTTQAWLEAGIEVDDRF